MAAGGPVATTTWRAIDPVRRPVWTSKRPAAGWMERTGADGRTSTLADRAVVSWPHPSSR